MGPWTEHRYRGIAMDGSDHHAADDGGEYSLVGLKSSESPGNTFCATSLVKCFMTM